MTRAREMAEQAVNNVWLTLAQRAVTLLGVPLALAAAYSYMGLRDRVTLAEADLRQAQQRVTTLETSATGLRTDLTVQAGHITRLQAQREGDAEIGRRINELREDVRAVNGRLDQMMTPSRRVVP